jgi:hypothetical protein
MQTREIQAADPAATRLAWLMLVIALVVGGCAVAGLKLGWPDFERWLMSDYRQLPARIALLNAAVILATALPAMVFAVYLWRRGATIRRSRRFPLETERVIRDTVVLRGEAASRRGRTIQWLAVVLGAAGFGLALALLRLATLISELASGPG